MGKLTTIEATILAALVSIVVGYGTDAEILALLPPYWAMFIHKAIIYGGGASILYKITPKAGGVIGLNKASRTPEMPLSPVLPPASVPETAPVVQNAPTVGNVVLPVVPK